MTDEQRTQRQALLRLAKTRPLTDEEKEMFQELLQADQGSAAAEQHLQDHYRATGRSRTWSKQELRAVAREIEKKSGRQPRHGRWQKNVQRLSWAAAMFVAAIGLLWVWAPVSDPVIEPAVSVSELLPTLTPTPEPTPIPEPTPTLNARHKYVDLSDEAPAEVFTLSLDDYSLSFEEATAEFDGALYVPNQMPEIWGFVGAAVTQQTSTGQPIIELAFIQRIGGRESLWILAQAPAVGLDVTEPLSITYQPLAVVDEINSYEDQTVEIGDYSGRGYQYEFVDRTNPPLSWQVYNTVTWVQDGQLLTLAIINEGNFPTNTVATMGANLSLELNGNGR